MKNITLSILAGFTLFSLVPSPLKADTEKIRVVMASTISSKDGNSVFKLQQGVHSNGNISAISERAIKAPFILLRSGGYFVTNTNSRGDVCLNLKPYHLNFAPTPSIITANGPVTFCIGDSVRLSGNIGGSWSTGDTAGSITIKTSGDYFVTNSDSSGSVQSNHIVVKVDTSPTASILVAGDTTTFCAGDSVVISGNVGGIWSSGATTSTLTVKSNGDYFVTNSNSCDTVISNHIIIKVNPLPLASVINANKSATICMGDSVILTGNVGGTWSTGDTSSSITVKTSGEYFVNNLNFCDTVSSNHIVVTVGSLPAVSVLTVSDTTTFCAGDSVVISGNVGGIWNNGATTSTFTVKSSGDYFVTNSNSCDTVISNHIIVKVNPLPQASVITANKSATICMGDSVILTGNVGGIWSTGDTSGSIIVKTSGDYFVNNLNFCDTFASNHIVVKVDSAVVVSVLTVSDTTVFCAGDSVVISGNVGGTWSNGATTSAITVKTSGDYFVTNSNSCDTLISNHILIKVNLLPVASVVSANKTTTICIGDSIILTGNTGGVWSTGDTSGSITIKTNGDYFVTHSNFCDTVISNHIIVTVDLMPLPSAISANKTTTICMGDSIILTGNAGGVWSTGDTSGSIMVKTNGDYFVRNSNSCDTVTSNHIIVKVDLPIIPVLITAGGDTSFCAGDSVTLSGNIGGIWNTGDTAMTIKVKTGGDYFVVHSNACDTLTSNHIRVTVNPLPAATVGINDTLCKGQSLTLGTPMEVGHTYKWTPTSGLNQSTTANPQVTPLITTTYILKETITATGCQATNSVTITVGTLPSCVIKGNNIICEGQSTQLCAPAGALTYLWSTGDTTRCINVDSIGHYSVVVTNSLGCSSRCSRNVIGGQGPCDITGKSIIYAGQSTEFCAPQGYTSYLWSNGATTRCITVNAAGTYAVSATNSYGCISTCSRILTVTAEVFCGITGDSVICQGSTTTLCAVSVEGNSYMWSTGESTRCIEIDCAGTFSVTVTNNGARNNCQFPVKVAATPPVALASVSIIGNLNPVQGESTTISASAGYHSYLWSTGATSQSITVSTSGNYVVQVSNGAGCSHSTSVYVNYASSRRSSPVIATEPAIIKTQAQFEIKAYPNPFNTAANFEFQTDQSNAHIRIEMTGLAGNKIATIFDGDVEKGMIYKARLDASQLAEGVYIYRMVSGDQIVSKKLVLIR